MYRQSTTDDKVSQNFLPLLLILLSIALRLIIVGTTFIIRNDDAISYLTATGHLGEYRDILNEALFPIGEWTNTEQWLRFISANDGFQFQKIMYDLGHYDIHPPFYFWLLHLWLKLIGLTSWSGPALNIVLDLISAAIILRFASNYLGRNGAVAVATLWLLHPDTILSSIWTRQYSLLTLLGVGFTIILFKIFVLKRHTALNIVSLALLTTVGLMTNYYFVLWISIGAGFVLFGPYRAIWSARRLAGMVVILGVTVVLFGLFFPDYFLPFIYYNLFDPNDINLGTRSRRLVANSALLFSPVALSLLLILLGNLRQSVATTLATTVAQGKLLLRQQPILYLLLQWMAGMTVALWFMVALLYMVGISPTHAMGPRYVTFITPYIAFFCYGIFVAGKLNHHRILSILFVGTLLLDGATVAMHLRENWTDTSALSILRNADAVVLDNVETGVWPGVILNLEKDVELFAADQYYLQEHAQQWVPRFCQQNSVFVSVFDDNAERERTELAALINTRCDVQLTSKLLGHVGIRYYEIYYRLPLTPP